MEHLQQIKPDYKTPFFEKQANAVQKFVQAAAERRITKNVAADEGNVKLFLTGAGYILGLLSIVFGFSFFSILLYNWATGRNLYGAEYQTNQFYFVAFLSVAFLLIIEIGKPFFIGKAYKDWLYKRKLNPISMLFIVIALILIGASFFTSVRGAEVGITNTSKVKREQNEAAATGMYNERSKSIQEQIASIDADIATKRENQKGLKKKGSGFSWDNSLTQAGATMFKKYEDEISKLQEKKTNLMETGNNSLDKMLAGTQAIVLGKVQQDNEYAEVMEWIAIVDELLIIIIALYKVNFDYRADIQHNPELIEEEEQGATTSKNKPFTVRKGNRTQNPPHEQKEVITRTNSVITQNEEGFENNEDDFEDTFEISHGSLEDMTLEMIENELAQMDVNKISANINIANNSIKNIQEGHNPKNRSIEHVIKRKEKWEAEMERYHHLIAQKGKLEKMFLPISA